MGPDQLLSEAMTIARDARSSAERAELEQKVSACERSDVPVLRSLAQAYRMLQRPPQ